MPSIRLAVAIFAVGNALFAFLGYREYRSLLDYCEDSPEVRAGGDSLSCLEPQHWFAIQFELLALLLLEIALVVVVGASVVHWRRRAGVDSE
jgi:hypothetical protein